MPDIIKSVNPEIWKYLTTSSIKGQIPTISELEEKFQISNSLSRCYLFALNHRADLFSNVTALKDQTTLKGTIKRLNNEKKELLEQNLELEELLSAYEATQNITLNKPPIITPSSIMADALHYQEEITAITLLSDIHYEEYVDPETVNGLNSYNLDIADDRIQKYFKRLLFLIGRDIKGGYNIKHLVLAMLGDMITGYLRDENLENNLLSPIDSVYALQEKLIAGIVALVNSNLFETITIICKRGNHGRTTKKKSFATGHKNSFETILYNNIINYFNNRPGYEKLNIIYDKAEFTTVQIYDKLWSFSHGDHFQYQGGIGGLMVPMYKFVYKQSKILKADYYGVGHWHTEMGIPFLFSNGSIIGCSAYSIGKGFPYEEPQQQLIYQDIRRGIVSNKSIILTNWK